MELDCEYMTPFGCPARDYAKSLQLEAIMEGEKDIQICKKMCCRDCEEVCGYRCGRAYGGKKNDQ